MLVFINFAEKAQIQWQHSFVLFPRNFDQAGLGKCDSCSCQTELVITNDKYDYLVAIGHQWSSMITCESQRKAVFWRQLVLYLMEDLLSRRY